MSLLQSFPQGSTARIVLGEIFLFTDNICQKMSPFAYIFSTLCLYFFLLRLHRATFHPLVSMNPYNLSPQAGGMRFAILTTTTTNPEKGMLIT
jgi:hypothetical protein